MKGKIHVLAAVCAMASLLSACAISSNLDMPNSGQALSDTAPDQSLNSILESVSNGKTHLDSNGIEVPDAEYLPAPSFGELPQNSVFHVNWQTQDGEYMAGTAFLMQTDFDEEPYLLTAIHYLGDDAISIQGEELKSYVLGGDLYDIAVLSPESIGQVASIVSIPDAKGVNITGAVDKDLAAFRLKDTTGITAWPAVAEPCKPGDIVYLACLLDAENSKTLESCLYPCVVTADDGKEIDYILEDNIRTQGASGGPLINSNGEIVGIHIGSDGSQRYGHSVQSIYQQLKGADTE